MEKGKVETRKEKGEGRDDHHMFSHRKRWGGVVGDLGYKKKIVRKVKKKKKVEWFFDTPSSWKRGTVPR